MRRPSLALLLPLGLLMAGCAGGEPEVQAVQRQPIAPEDLLGSDAAAIQGHVYSEEMVPLQGAEVTVQGSQVIDRTDGSGFFQLRDIPPGSHVLLAGRLGYDTLARRVELEAGAVLSMNLTLTPLVLDAEPYPEVLNKVGHLECGFGTAALVAPCTYPYRLVHGGAKSVGINLSQYGAPSDLHDNRFWLNVTIKPGTEQLVAELVWSPGSAAATRMNLFILCGDFDPVLNECVDRIRYGASNGHAGTTPIKAVIDGKEFRTKGCPSTKYCLKDKPIWIANDIALPFNTPPQVAFQQKFEVWDTIFYNAPGPDGYSALPDQ